MKTDRLEENSILATGSESKFWKVLLDYIHTASNPAMFLSIKEEMGMKGFWYLKGYIKAMQDVERRVTFAKQAIERASGKVSPDKG